jgi:hypothetical protein
VVLVLGHALWRSGAPVAPRAPVSRLAELAALGLALCSLFLGFAAVDAVSIDGMWGALTLADLGSAVVLILGGVALAAGLARRLPPVRLGDAVTAILRPLRHATVIVGGLLALADGALRQWPVAGLALIAVAIAFGAAMVAAG